MTTTNFRANIAVELESSGSDGMLYSSNNNNLSTQAVSLTRYEMLYDALSFSITTESQTQLVARYSATFSKLCCYVQTNGISAASTITFRKNTANGNQSISITASTTGAFADSSNSDSVVDADLVNYKIDTGGSGTSIAISWIGVLYTLPSGGTVGKLYQIRQAINRASTY